jgi:hypothetical protein
VAAVADWGLPDWRDTKAYPTSQTPRLVWWWQFLRRRPDYRDEWQHADGKRVDPYGFAYASISREPFERNRLQRLYRVRALYDPAADIPYHSLRHRVFSDVSGSVEQVNLAGGVSWH